jgi:SAM-dependent methyltransferase
MIDGRYVSEAEKSVTWLRRQLQYPRLNQALRGVGIDLGAGAPPYYWPGRFSGIITVYPVDREHANRHIDAQTLVGVADGSYDFVHASHILEHLDDPSEALRNWLRVLRPGGHAFISVPHRDLYEQRDHLPSKWAPEHKRFYLPYRGDGCDTVGFSDWLISEQFDEVRPHPAMPTVSIRPQRFMIHYFATGDWGYERHSGPGGHPQGEYCIDALLEKL